MELVEALSNPEIQDRLSRLSDKLTKIASSEAQRRTSAFERKRPAGAVAAAIVDALIEAGGPMRMCEIHAAVEALIGQSVPRSTVKSCLSNNSDATGRFIRLGRGRYSAEVPSQP
jgi:hypothetical protein